MTFATKGDWNEISGPREFPHSGLMGSGSRGLDVGIFTSRVSDYL